MGNAEAMTTPDHFRRHCAVTQTEALGFRATANAMRDFLKPFDGARFFRKPRESLESSPSKSRASDGRSRGPASVSAGARPFKL